MTATPIGTLRRLQGLAVLGWPTHVLGTRLGATTADLDAILAGTATPTTALATRLATTYEHLSGHPGPDTTTRDLARTAGWTAPLLWHGLDIDHPSTAPYPDPRPTGTPGRIHIDDIRHWQKFGLSLDNLAGRLGVRVTSLKRAIERAEHAGHHHDDMETAA